MKKTKSNSMSASVGSTSHTFISKYALTGEFLVDKTYAVKEIRKAIRDFKMTGTIAC